MTAMARESRVEERTPNEILDETIREFERDEERREDAGRTIIIEQTRENIRWKLVDLYVVSVITGEVNIREGIPVPKRNDKDERTRWFIPALSTEATDADTGKGWVAFATLDQTIDYLESWTNTQRKRITAAYRWMGTNTGRDRDRERRLGS